VLWRTREVSRPPRPKLRLAWSVRSSRFRIPFGAFSAPPTGCQPFPPHLFPALPQTQIYFPPSQSSPSTRTSLCLMSRNQYPRSSLLSVLVHSVFPMKVSSSPLFPGPGLGRARHIFSLSRRHFFFLIVRSPPAIFSSFPKMCSNASLPRFSENSLFFLVTRKPHRSSRVPLFPRLPFFPPYRTNRGSRVLRSNQFCPLLSKSTPTSIPVPL